MADYPYIEFVLSVGTYDIVGEAYPDTGFDGAFIIPTGVGREILAPPEPTPWQLADGSIRRANSWSGVVEIEGRRFRAEVIAVGSRFLLGREILDQLEICFRFGRQVTLRFADEPAN